MIDVITITITIPKHVVHIVTSIVHIINVSIAYGIIGSIFAIDYESNLLSSTNVNSSGVSTASLLFHPLPPLPPIPIHIPIIILTIKNAYSLVLH
jgi:hypothetical protein